MRKKLLIVGIIGIIMFLICSIKSDAVTSKYNYSSQRSSSSSYRNTTSSTKKSSKKEDNDMDTKLNVIALIMKSALIGLIVSVIICFIIWLKHKPVKVAKNAGHYLNQNSIEITDSYDHFSTSRLDKIPLNKD